jgi:tRNA threonylcarbamoyladenosine dehydratase
VRCSFHDYKLGQFLILSFRTVPFDIKDVGYIFEEMWLGKSVVSGTADKPALVRWDRSKPLSFTNVICLTREEAAQHDQLPDDVDIVAHYGEGKVM